MAKETMQAISNAEQKARETVLNAKEEAHRLEAEAQAQGQQAVQAAVKEAGKKAGVLCGVARADAEKLGVSRQTISKWETGETLPDIRQAKRRQTVSYQGFSGNL